MGIWSDIACGISIVLVIHSLDLLLVWLHSGALEAGAQCAPYKKWWAMELYRPRYPLGRSVVIHSFDLLLV